MLTTTQAAKYLGISPYYLRNIRQLQHNHDGPEYTIGLWRGKPTCYYALEELDRWSKSHKWRKKIRKEKTICN